MAIGQQICCYQLLYASTSSPAPELYSLNILIIIQIIQLVSSIIQF